MEVDQHGVEVHEGLPLQFGSSFRFKQRRIMYPHSKAGGGAGAAGHRWQAGGSQTLGRMHTVAPSEGENVFARLHSRYDSLHGRSDGISIGHESPMMSLRFGAASNRSNSTVGVSLPNNSISEGSTEASQGDASVQDTS